MAKANKIPGVRQISMSWGCSEFRSETRQDAYFQQTGVVYFAASGDTGGQVIYPGCSRPPLKRKSLFNASKTPVSFVLSFRA